MIRENPAPMRDGFHRPITYLRLSVTDRCDLRCRYCMAEKMTFMPPRDLMTIDELATITGRFIERGVRTVRLTGGEPLARHGVIDLAGRLGAYLKTGDLDELTLTTNGTRLADLAQPLADAGIRRVNVSLDTRDAQRFRHVTRWGDLARTLAGIEAAAKAGMRVKINMVALKGLNEDEIPAMVEWCGAQGHDLVLIETMPLGWIDEDRTDRYLPLDQVRRDLEQRFTLLPSTARTAGPSRYWTVAETGGRLGFITPMSHNFCESCNRVRLAANGKLYMCLGHEDHVDLKQALREGGPDAMDHALDQALRTKPARHFFQIGEQVTEPALARHMNVTGG